MTEKMTQLKAKVRQLASELERHIRNWQQQTQHWLKVKLSKQR